MRPACSAIVAAAALAAVSLAAPAPAAGQGLGQMVRGQFELSTGQSLDAAGNTVLVLTTSITHRRLVFFRTRDGYEARYRIYIDLRDRHNRRVRGEVVEESVTAEDFETTRAPRVVSTVRAQIPVAPGEYSARVEIEVLRTSLRYEREAKIQIHGREHGAFEVGRPFFSIPQAARRDDKPPAGEIVYTYCHGAVPEGFEPLPGDVFSHPEGWLRTSLTILSPAGERTSRSVVLSTRISGSGKHMIYYSRRTIDTGAEGRATVCLDLCVDDLPMGRYEIHAAAGIPHSTKKAVSHGAFTILLSRAMFERRFEDTLELLSCVAEERHLEPLRNAPVEERAAEWDRFWTSREAVRKAEFDGDLDEFLERLAFVLEHFGKHQAGWKTDMGRIFIRLGPPDHEAERDGTLLGTRLKVWYYYSRGIVFIFEDPIGSGQYRLIDTRSI